MVTQVNCFLTPPSLSTLTDYLLSLVKLADPGQALFQRPSWAFELRRTTEKADLLIIRMDESSFALRRAPLHQMVDIQVARKSSSNDLVL